jgi:rhamnosyltransferase
VGAAQNAGIAVLRRQGVRYVLLLDQDSVCAPDMVERLVAAAHELADRGVGVAAVGPRYRAAPGGPLSGFVRFGRWGGRGSVSGEVPDGGAVEADFLIASGALIPIDSLDRVGPMEEELFIDHVDTEWFLRARHAGLRCFGVPGAEMEHALGEGASRLWFGRWRHVPDHRPFRYYYIVRNSLLLYRRAYAPLRWIVGDVVRLLGLALLNATVRPGRVLRLRMMARGVRDGIRGIAGPSPLRP